MFLFSHHNRQKYLLGSNHSTPVGERNCSVAPPATAIEYAAHSIAAFGTVPAEAPPQLLVNLLEWLLQLCKAFLFQLSIEKQILSYSSTNDPQSCFPPSGCIRWRGPFLLLFGQAKRR